jgi:hypothetical protein
MTRRNFLFGIGLVGFAVSNIPRILRASINYDLLRCCIEVPHCHEDAGELVVPRKKQGRNGGKPPSKWLRSLNAKEIRVALKTMKAPPAYVAGMSFMYHLTYHHGFRGSNLRGLTTRELFKLHSCAHAGY